MSSNLEKFVNDKKAIMGGGYTFNLKDQINGQAAVVGYDDVKVHDINLAGGNKSKRLKNKRSTNMKSKKSNIKFNMKSKKKNNKSSTNKNSKKKVTNKKTTKKHSKKYNTKINKTKKYKGGCNYPFTGSNNNYDLKDLNFGALQPNWGVYDI